MQQSFAATACLPDMSIFGAVEHTSFDSANIDSVRAEFIRLADDIEANWVDGDLAAACNAIADFRDCLRESSRIGTPECRMLKRSLCQAIDALARAWLTNRLAAAVGHITGLAESMKSN